MDYSQGSCYPSFEYCHPIAHEYWGGMFFKNCEFTPVLDPVKNVEHTETVIEVEITQEMAQKIVNKKPVTLLNFLFMPNQYIIVKVKNEQDLIDAHLYFSGIFDTHKHEPIPDDPRIVNQIDLNQLKVYFSSREPTVHWGYPTQLPDLYFDRAE